MPKLKLEVRTADIGGVEGRTLTGYAALYNTWSKPLMGLKGEFREQIAPGAFDGQKSNVSLFYMHDSKQVLANTKSGTLVLQSDERGLRYTATLGENARDEAVLDQVRRGLLNEMSFGFRVPEGGDEWKGRERTLRRVELREVSVVEVGAYSGTLAEARNEPEPQPEPKKVPTVMATNMNIRQVRAKLAELAERNNAEGLTADERMDIACEIEELREVGETITKRDAGARESAIPAKRVADRRDSADEARSQPQYRDAFYGWLKGGNVAEFRELITTASSSILMPKQVEETIYKYLQANSIARQVCDYRQVARGDATLRYNTLEPTQYTNAWAVPDTSSTTAATDIDPGFAEVSLKPLPILPKTQVSEQLLYSANFDVEAEVVDNLMRQFQRMTEAAYIAGVTNGPSNALFTVQASATQITTATSSGTTRALAVTAAATVANLMDMRYTQLPTAYWGSSAWILPKDTYAKVADLRAGTSSNVPVFVPSADAGITQGASGFLLGLPVYVTDYLPTHVATGTTGKNVLALLGNFNESYAIREWNSMSMRRDDLTAAQSARIVYRGFGWGNAAFTRGKAMVQLQVTNA